jgi:hypothetical protein
MTVPPLGATALPGDTPGPDGPAPPRSASPAWSAAKMALPLAAVAVGAAIGWRVTGGGTAMGVLAVPLAAANGYSKAYSP